MFTTGQHHSQTNPFTTFQFYLFKIHFNIILPPTTRSSKRCLSFLCFSSPKPVCIFVLPHPRNTTNIVHSEMYKMSQLYILLVTSPELCTFQKHATHSATWADVSLQLCCALLQSGMPVHSAHLGSQSP